MNKYFLRLITFSLLLFIACQDDNEKELPEYKRGLTQDDIKALKKVSIESYDIGWSLLKFSSENGEINLELFIDPVFSKSEQVPVGVYNSKDTKSFQKFFNFKCKHTEGIPDDVVAIAKNGDIYTVSFKYTENDEIFEGIYTGNVQINSLFIDYSPDCY